MRLSTDDHDRGVAGMTYVYPVVSRRARGVSVGVNLNPNNACNWRCVYCQVPGLTFGKGPPIDLELLEDELTRMLEALTVGDYMERHVPEESRRLNDVAFSGNGEPTSSPEFAEAVALARRVRERLALPETVQSVLITNGSLTHQAAVQRGLEELREANGEVWFKLDGGTEAWLAKFNGDRAGLERREANLAHAARCCPTWVQTMMLAWNGAAPDDEELEAYLAVLGRALDAGVSLRGVHLYGLARTSHQPEAPELSALPAEWMEALAERIRALGLRVELSL